jgi:serine protease Do
MTSFQASLVFLTAALLAPNMQSQTNCGSMAWQLEPVAQMDSTMHAEGVGYLGVRLADIDSERAKALKLNEDRGVEIKAVMEGSPADKAGIQPGDVLLTYNGETILGAQQLSRLVQETPPGRHLKVQYWRDGKTQTTMVVVGGEPHISSPFQRFPVPNWSAPNMDFPTPLLVWQNSLIGIDFEHVDSQLASYFGVKSGVLIRSVERGSPADRAGLHAGDVIFSVAQQPLSSEHEFSSLLRRGTSVPMSVMRDHRRVDLTVAVP